VTLAWVGSAKQLRHVAAWYGLREGTLQADKFLPRTGTAKSKAPRVSPQGFPTWQRKEVSTRFLSGAKHLYQSVLKHLGGSNLGRFAFS